MGEESEFFVKGIPIEETIKNHTNIYDFCGRQKFKGQDYGTISTLVGNDIIIEKQQKNVRYYVSNKGSSFIKNYAKRTTEVINKGYQITIFNSYVEKEINNYDIKLEIYSTLCSCPTPYFAFWSLTVSYGVLHCDNGGGS